MENYMEGLKWEARFKAVRELPVGGTLTREEAQKIAREIAKRLNAAWEEEHEHKRVVITVNEDAYAGRKCFIVVGTLSAWGDGRIVDGDFEAFKERAELTAAAVVREVVETIKLAKRIALISSALRDGGEE